MTNNIVINRLGAIFTILFINSLYIRGFQIPLLGHFIPASLTTTYLIPLFIIIVSILKIGEIYLDRTNIKLTRQYAVIIFALIIFPIISVTYDTVFRGISGPSLLFLVEHSNNMLLFIVSIIITKELEFERVFFFVYVIGFLFSLSSILWLIIYVGEVRRLGAGGPGDLPIAANHLAHGLAIAVIPGIISLIERRGNIFIQILMVSVILITIFLTGGRSAVLGLLLSFCIIIVYYRSIAIKYIIYFGLAFIFLLLSLTSLAIETSTITWERFTVDRAYEDLLDRLSILFRVFENIGIDIPNLMFGIGINNYRVVVPETVWDPHNLLLSYLLYTGVPAAITLLIIVSITYKKLIVQLLGSDVANKETLLILLSLTITLSYSTFSGRMTRIYTIWITLGLAIGHVMQYELHKLDIYNKV